MLSINFFSMFCGQFFAILLVKIVCSETGFKSTVSQDLVVVDTFIPIALLSRVIP